MTKPIKKVAFWSSLTPHSLIALSFLALISIGAFLLWLPISSANGTSLPLVSSIFTATSATCVTGLVVIDIGTDLSLFGQLVVLILIQLGGLSVMTLSTFLLVLLGRRLGMQSEFALMDAYGVEGVKGLYSLLKWAIAMTFFFEAIGCLILHWRYQVLVPSMGDLKTWYYAAFHSISAFCNAGISLHPDNLMGFQRDLWYLNVVNMLIVLGGLGFLPLYNLITIRFWKRDLRKRGRIALHTKIVLSATAVLIIAGTVLFLAQEWDNTLKDLPLVHKINSALFHSVTPRTAGFNVLPMSELSEGARYVTGILMFIGGSPGSAAGGIKTTTVVVLIFTVIAMCKRRTETSLFSRTISNLIVREALVIFFVLQVLILLAFGLLLHTEAAAGKSLDASKLFFETLSAFSTVGLTIDYTQQLSLWGRWVIIFSMYIGRLGPVAIALFIGREGDVMRIRYAEEEVVVG
jgi:trk system potassium uptake protein TrkH